MVAEVGQETRNKFSDYWKENGVKESDEFAIQTNIIHQEWAELYFAQPTLPQLPKQ